METLYSFPIITDLDLAIKDYRISPAQLKGLYRITQEAVANAAKHAAPTRVNITLSLKPAEGELELCIADDGAGFTKESHRAERGLDTVQLDRPEERHLGLLTMQQRITGLGGRLELFSEPGQGTKVRLYLPAQGQPAGSLSQVSSLSA